MRFQIQHIHTVSPGHVDRSDLTRRVAQLAEVFAPTAPSCGTGMTLSRRPGSRLGRRGHQNQRPSSATSDGIRKVRTISVSSSSPTPTVNPKHTRAWIFRRRCRR
jgi:hypothetical protein